QPVQPRLPVQAKQPVQQQPVQSKLPAQSRQTIQPRQPLPSKQQVQTKQPVQPKAPPQPKPQVQAKQTVQPKQPIEPKQPAVKPGPAKALSPQESHQVLQVLNQNRGGKTGINSHRLPEGRVTALSNGHHVIETNRGSRMEVRSNGTLEKVTLRDGRVATFHSSGQLGSVQAPGMRIDHGLGGERTIVTERNGRRLVSSGPNGGYLERPYLHRNGRVYVQRT